MRTTTRLPASSIMRNRRVRTEFTTHKMHVFGTRRSMETFATARCSGAIRHLPTGPKIRVWFVLGEDAMTFTTHASKDGQSVVTVRISPAVAVDGKFTLPIQLGNSSPLRSSIGFHRLLAKRPDRG